MNAISTYNANNNFSNILLLGTGDWGLSLAFLLIKNRYKIILWNRSNVIHKIHKIFSSAFKNNLFYLKYFVFFTDFNLCINYLKKKKNY